MRARNSVVLAASWSSVRSLVASSKLLIWARTGSIFLTARSLEVPKTLARAALNTVGSFARWRAWALNGCAGRGLRG